MQEKDTFSEKMRQCGVLCAFLIVWAHAYNVEVYGLSNAACVFLQTLVSQRLAQVAVPFFFFQSAFFLYDKEKQRTIREVYVSRVRSIVIPYLLWNTIYTVVFTILTKMNLSHSGLKSITLEGILKGIFLYGCNPAYWFMSYLIVFTLGYPLIDCVIGRNKCIAVISVIVLMLFTSVWDFNWMNKVCIYYTGAVIGYWFKDYAIASVRMDTWKKWVCLFLLLIAYCMSCYRIFAMPSIVFQLIMIMLLWCFANVLNVRTEGGIWEMSFLIYTLHPLILEAIEKVIYIVFPHTVGWMMLDYILAPIFTIGIIYAIVVFLKKYFPVAHRVLNGGR